MASVILESESESDENEEKLTPRIECKRIVDEISVIDIEKQTEDEFRDSLSEDLPLLDEDFPMIEADDERSRLDYVLVTDCDEPSCYKEAILTEDSVMCEQAMQLEYNSIIANETWELTESPQGNQALPCKWVYKKKYTTEDPGPKYKMTTVRPVLGFVATEDLELNQMDVKTAFLHRDLEGNVYMVQPEGFEMESEKPKRAKLVCRFCKALYGLKQGFRQWYLKFDKYMQSQGYERSQEDHCLYTRKLSNGSLIILILYVDDMLIAGKSKDKIANLKKSLSTQFAMKYLGDANHFFGMRIKRDRQRGILELSQEQYVHKVLEHFSMQAGNTLSTPMQPCLKISKDNCPKFDAEKAQLAKVPYSLAVGSLMYAMVAMIPDIAFAVGVVSHCQAFFG
ncbi:hypothetical protein L7F22_036433 [Adiantum nelumboides]|nr:hypothetical protein [Adiantum nelumboides]